MNETITLNNPIMELIATKNSYSQKIAQVFWENINTLETQDRTTTRIIEKRMDFLEFNLEKMMDLPKIPNFDRTEATSISLWIDRIREKFGSFNKNEMREVLEILEVLRK